MEEGGEGRRGEEGGGGRRGGKEEEEWADKQNRTFIGGEEK